MGPLFSSIAQHIIIIFTVITMPIMGIFNHGNKVQSHPTGSASPIASESAKPTPTSSPIPKVKKSVIIPSPQPTATLTPTPQPTPNEDLSKLENQIQANSKKLECLELVKKTPANGPAQFINNDIVGYYKTVLEILDIINKTPEKFSDPEAELKFYTDLAAQAKPLYDAYLAKCGN